VFAFVHDSIPLQRKVCELETVVKTLETNLAEKEAAIQILKSSKTLSSGNFEDFFAAVAAAAPASQVPASIGVTDHSNVLSIPIQQPQQAHRILHNKSLSHLVNTAPSMASPIPTVVTPSSYGFSPTPASYAATPSFHHVKQLSTPSVTAYHAANNGSRLAPNFLVGKGRSLTPSADMLLLRSATPTHLAAMDHLKAGRRDSAPGEIFSTSLTNIRGGST
jgi:hypothetical protein